MASAVANLIIIGGLLYVGYYLYTETDTLDQIKKLLKGDGGVNPNAPKTAPTSVTNTGTVANVSAGSGGLIYPGTGKTWVLKDNGNRTTNYASGGSDPTRRWVAINIGAVNKLETYARIKFGNCKDTISF